MARNLDEAVVINVVDSNGDIVNVLNARDFVINNPYNVNIDSVFLPNTKPMDLDTFFTVSKMLIEDAQLREGINEDSFIKLIEEYPPEDINKYGNEVITWKVVERKPGMMNTKGTGRPHRKATYSHQEHRPDLPNKRAIWLEKLFVNSAFAFEVKGAERFYFKERLSDNYLTTNGQRIFSRPLRFFLRFREFDAKADTMIRNILVDIGILPKN